MLACDIDVVVVFGPFITKQHHSKPVPAHPTFAQVGRTAWHLCEALMLDVSVAHPGEHLAVLGQSSNGGLNLYPELKIDLAQAERVPPS